MKNISLPTYVLLAVFATFSTVNLRSAGTEYCLPEILEVDSRGVFLDDLVECVSGPKLPHVLVFPAPDFGRIREITSTRVVSLLRDRFTQFSPDKWTGARTVTVSRKTRSLTQRDLETLLVAALQEKYLEPDSRLELETSRPWAAMQIPDEPISLRLAPLPASGLSSYLILRFTLEVAGTRFGPWQLPCQAQVWRDTWVSARALQRGELISKSDLSRQAVDTLRHRNLFRFPEQEIPLELAQNIVKGCPLTTRHVRLRPLVVRNKMVNAQFRQGAISISIMVQVLEDGIGGQVVRVRNSKTRREFYARVLDTGMLLIGG
jgi:flagella basal body P-ring formation protein FlgA